MAATRMFRLPHLPQCRCSTNCWVRKHKTTRNKPAKFYLSAFPAPFSNGFSSGKKYVPCILKYVRPISKYVGHIFSLLWEGYNSLKMSFHFFLPESRHFRTVFPLLNTSKHIMPCNSRKSLPAKRTMPTLAGCPPLRKKKQKSSSFFHWKYSYLEKNPYLCNPKRAPT